MRAADVRLREPGWDGFSKMPEERLERGDDVELSCDEREGLGDGEDEGEYQE